MVNSADLNMTYHYYHAEQSVVEVRNGSGLVLKQKLFAGMFNIPGGYVDQLLQLAVNEDPFATDGSEDECERFFYALHNANYNLLALVDEAGAIAERYEYTPYGQRQVYFSPGPNDPLAMAPTTISRRWDVGGVSQPYGLNTVGHQGLSHDEVTELVYNRARMLHPRLGRFMQRDPLNQNRPGGGYHDGLNLYQYVRGDPVNSVDPAGKAADGSVRVSNVHQEECCRWRSRNVGERLIMGDGIFDVRVTIEYEMRQCGQWIPGGNSPIVGRCGESYLDLRSQVPASVSVVPDSCCEFSQNPNIDSCAGCIIDLMNEGKINRRAAGVLIYLCREWEMSRHPSPPNIPNVPPPPQRPRPLPPTPVPPRIPTR